MSDFQFFDQSQDHTIYWSRLPHWAQAGTLCFITFRTADSLPREVIERFIAKRNAILAKLQIDSTGDWRNALNKLPVATRGQAQWELFTNWDEHLDQAAGACVLRESELSEIVMNSLLHFDGDRYFLTDAVVMPNHAHLLVAFHEEEMLQTQCKSWKKYTAGKINEWLRANENRGTFVPATGEFWQVDQFDHLVRSPEEFLKFRQYIAGNPLKAGLPAGSYRLYSKQLRR